MDPLALRPKLEVERVVNTGDYRDFKGLRFKVIDCLRLGQDVELTTNEPTYIRQSTGAMKVIAKAPTIIEGSTAKLTIDGYAPVLVRGGTAGMEAHLRENSAIEGVTNYVNIKAAPYLELIVDQVRDFNGVYNEWKPVHLNAPEGNRGVILFTGGASSLNFEYDSQEKFYLPRGNNPGSLIQRVRALLR